MHVLIQTDFKIKNEIKRIVSYKIKMKHILILLFISFTFVKSDIICPYNVDSYSCLTRIVNNQTNSTCEVQKCFKWDNAECISTGKEQTSALILQSIPFTGVFGAGFGNISRWDLFGVSMGLFFWYLFIPVLYNIRRIFLLF